MRWSTSENLEAYLGRKQAFIDGHVKIPTHQPVTSQD